MNKFIKITFALLLILFGISQGFKLINNLDNSNFTYNIKDESADKDNKSSISKKNTEAANNGLDYSNNNSTIKENNINDKSNEPNNTSNNSSNKANESSDNDHTIAISSSLYNAVVSLDEKNKEVNIKLVSTDDINNITSDNYINFDDEEIKYLLENSSSLLEEFKSNNLFEKYDMVSKMLRQYDTNIKESDLISMAISYLK